MHQTKSAGKYVEISKSPFPLGSHRKCLILPETRCDNAYVVLPTREAQNWVRSLSLGVMGHQGPGTHRYADPTSHNHIVSINDLVWPKALAI